MKITYIFCYCLLIELKKNVCSVKLSARFFFVRKNDLTLFGQYVLDNVIMKKWQKDVFNFHFNLEIN